MLCRLSLGLLLGTGFAAGEPLSKEARFFDGSVHEEGAPLRELKSASLSLSARISSNPAPQNTGSVTEASFNAALASLNRTVGPVVKAKYRKAYLATGEWRKEFSETSAGGSFYHPDQPGVSWDDSWGVHITGWLARLPGFTVDSITLVLCHELGHHVAGGGAEVEADYFAPTCLRWAWGEPSDAVAFRARILSAYRPTAEFRRKSWLRSGFSATEVDQMLQCRERVIIQGSSGSPVEQCAGKAADGFPCSLAK